MNVYVIYLCMIYKTFIYYENTFYKLFYNINIEYNYITIK